MKTNLAEFAECSLESSSDFHNIAPYAVEAPFKPLKTDPKTSGKKMKTFLF